MNLPGLQKMMLGEDLKSWARLWSEVLVAEARGRGLDGQELNQARSVARDAYLMGCSHARRKAHKFGSN